MLPLFAPLTIKQLNLRNRLVMPPMALDIASKKGEVTHTLIDHYRARARGFGLVIVEHAYVSPEGKAHPRQLAIDKDDTLPGLKTLVAEIHKFGIPVGIQISHAGARALDTPMSPSSGQSQYLTRYGGKEKTDYRVLPKKLNPKDIMRIVNDFAKAARRAQQAGFDFVEIHGAHGYLLNQFYSPLTNLRHDEYGGNLERRLKFPLEVVRAVRNVLDERIPLFYRLGADDRLPDGNTLADSIKAAPMLTAAGVDCLDLSGGIGGYIKQGPEGFFSYLAEGIKPVVDVPILVTGGIKTVEKANEIVARGAADLIGVGRTILKHPEWAYQAWVKHQVVPTYCVG